MNAGVAAIVARITRKDTDEWVKLDDDAGDDQAFYVKLDDGDLHLRGGEEGAGLHLNSEEKRALLAILKADAGEDE